MLAMFSDGNSIDYISFHYANFYIISYKNTKSFTVYALWAIIKLTLLVFTKYNIIKDNIIVFSIKYR